MAQNETPARPFAPNRSGSSSMMSPTSLDDSPQSPNPASSLLQDMLREKKAENRRLGRVPDTDPRRVVTAGNALDDRNVYSSPIAPPSRGSAEAAHARQTSASGGRDAFVPKVMGMREMERHISNINKQNFDLKLELFHRRQRSDALEAKLVKMQDLENDNTELQSINEDLLKELELRDVAVKEAVDLICELEAKVEAMEATKYTVNIATPDPEAYCSVSSANAQPKQEENSLDIAPPHAADENQESLLRQQDTLPTKSDFALPPPAKSAKRHPSFLREDKPSTSALRSLYRFDTNTSYLSLNRAGSPQRDQDTDTYTLNSPRLSVLSESSFQSVYGKSPKLSSGPLHDLDITRTRPCLDYRTSYRPDHALTRNISDGSKNRSHDKTNAMVSQRSSNDGSEHRSDKSFLSRVEATTNDHSRSSSHTRNEHLSKWLDESVSEDEGSPLRYRSHLEHSSKPRRSSPSTTSNNKFSSIEEILHNKPPPNPIESIPSLPALTKPVFAGPEILPPTPDTMSTAQKASSSTQSIITEKSLKDTSRPHKTLDTPAFDSHTYTTGSLGLDFENDLESSDEEQSVRVQQSEADTTNIPPDAFDSFPFISPSSKRVRILGDTPTRPPLSTNMMFDGEDHAASRALSYPSPKFDRRRSSIATTPTRPEPSRGMTTHSPLSPKDWTSSSTVTPSPSRASQQIQKTSIASSHENISSNDTASLATESKIPKTTTSSRLKTLFRRSNSQNNQVLMGGTQFAEERESKIARPGTAGVGLTAAGGGGIGRSASTSQRIFGGRRG